MDGQLPFPLENHLKQREKGFQVTFVNTEFHSIIKGFYGIVFLLSLT